jgi:hypothetical protein
MLLDGVERPRPSVENNLIIALRGLGLGHRGHARQHTDNGNKHRGDKLSHDNIY